PHHSRLALEPPNARGPVARGPGGAVYEHFDRNPASRGNVNPLIHRAHSARADQADEMVLVAQPLAAHKASTGFKEVQRRTAYRHNLEYAESKRHLAFRKIGEQVLAGSYVQSVENRPMERTSRSGKVATTSTVPTWTDAPGANESLPMNCVGARCAR